MRVDARNKTGAGFFPGDISLPNPLKMHCNYKSVNIQYNLNVYESMLSSHEFI